MPLHSPNIHIGAWNIDCLYSRISGGRTSKLSYPDVFNLLQKLDIFFLSETHCKDSDPVELDNFHIVQNIRPKSLKAPRNFGGLAVGVRNSILCGVTFLKCTNSEFMWIKLNKSFFGTKHDIYICSLYISPAGSSFSRHRDDIFSLIESDILKYSRLGKCFVLGDFNARTLIDHDYIDNDGDKFLDIDCSYQADLPLARRNFDTHPIDMHGKALLLLCKSSGLRILNGRKLGDLQGNFTCYNYVGKPSTIDYILCDVSLIPDVHYVKVHDLTPYSIHCMISCRFNVNMSNSNGISDDVHSVILNDQPSQFTWNTTSVSKWQSALNDTETRHQVDSFIKSASDTSNSNSDLLVNKFTTMLNSIGHKAGIQKKKPNSALKSKKSMKASHKWYDDDCRQTHRKLNSISRCIRKNPTNAVNLIDSYRALRRKYRKLLKSKKHAFRSNIFNMLDNLESKDPKAFWNLYNELTGQQKHSDSNISASEWWSHFNMLMNRTIKHKDTDFEQSIEAFWSTFDINSASELDSEITHDDIRNAIKSLKCRKAPGLDGIRNEMLKLGSSLFIPCLAKLFNHIVNKGKFPDSWRQSTLSVIHKKGDKNNPKNYRGIAVSSNLCKLFCLVLHQRLSSFVDANNVIPKEQIGFRKGARTQDHIFTLKTLIDKYISKLDKLYVCFVDFASAFDTIWRNALLYKLVHVGVKGKLVSIIHDMYSSVLFSVKYKNKLTAPLSSNVGVKQGCVLSPLFFNIFLHDLPSIFDDSCDPVILDTVTLSCLMYADDLVIMSQSAVGLQNALNKLNSYCLKWKLTVNVTKTKIMIFNKSGRVLSNHSFTFGDNNLIICNEYNYLGIVFTPSGTFTKAINLLYEKACKAFFKIRENLYNSSSSCCMKLFLSLIRPILCYGCEVWSPFLIKNLKPGKFIGATVEYSTHP